MTSVTCNELTERYLSALTSYLEGDQETALQEAYELGRDALAAGVTPLVTAHHQVLQTVLEQADSPEEITRLTEAAAAVMMESMAVVEMALRGYQEANARLSDEILDHKKTQAALEQAREAAEAATRAKSQFLANMSHEIRTPMNGILGMTELALDTELTAEQREYLDLVKISADSLLSLLNDILDFSKIEAGKLELDPISFDLRDHLDDTIKAVSLRTLAKGLELACQVRPNVPDWVIADAGRLRQIVINLVGNAIKFTERGEVVVHVEVESCTADDALLHFAVTDTGIGIPEEKRHLLFRSFSQADSSTTRKYGGTGLGLAISQRLVHMMGGRIWVDSVLGQGSTFHFTTRVGLQQDAPRQSRAGWMDVKNLSVLVVDDHATNRRILQELLTSWGMRPALVASGEEALAAMERAVAESHPFRLALIDCLLPGMDGFALTRAIKQRPELGDPVLLMLASTVDPKARLLAKDLGLAAYLTKPIKQSELLNTVMATLREAAPETAAHSRPTKRTTLHKLRILLAEDSLVNQRLGMRLLEKWGHQVVVAASGRQTLELLEKQSIDLVLMDVEMPEMDGIEATRIIRSREAEIGRHLPIIAMTAHAMKGDRDRCLEAGMDAYVSKPIQPQELFQAIEALELEPEAGTDSAGQ